MPKTQSPPLTEKEILSVYRNEFFEIDDPCYFCKNMRNRKIKYNREYSLLEKNVEQKERYYEH